MKNELKISTLSIVCVLCAAVAAPAFGAASVRSLGGAGTYSSASSAAATKSTGTSAQKSVSAGTTRAAATPRLSIGKYLGGATVVGGNTSMKPEQSGNHGGDSTSGNLQERIRILEEFMGYSSTGDNIPEQLKDIQLDIKELEADLSALTGAVTSVVYEDGELTVTQNGKNKVFDLAKDFAGKSEIEALQSAIDAIVVPDLTDYAKKTDLDGFLTSAELSELTSDVAALELASASMDEAIKALQGGMIDEEALNAKLAELETADKDLNDAIEALKNMTPSTEGMVNKDYVDGVVSRLESADAGLLDLINAIQQPDVDKNYVDTAINGLNDVIDDLLAADLLMNQKIAGLEALLANAATKDEIKDFITSGEVDSKIDEAIAGLLTADDIKDFVKTGKLQEEIAKLATKDEIADFVISTEVSDAIAEATKDLLTADDIADFVKSGDMVTAIENATSNLATKQEVEDAKSELQAAIDKINAGSVELTNYYTKAQSDEKFAAKSDLTGLQDSIDANAAGVKENAEDIASLELAVQSAASEAADAKLAAGSAQNLADLNAADIKALQEAGYVTSETLQQNYVTNETLQQQNYVTNETLQQQNYVTNETLQQQNYVTNETLQQNYVSNTALEEKGYLTEEVAASTYLTEENVNNFVEIEDGSITAVKLADGAVTAEKIDTGTDNAGEMIMLMSNGDGTSTWVSVTVDAE
ncbi:MAG: hypothetical protein ACLRFO_00260 [Alphaproteobacteria bacterium]